MTDPTGGEAPEPVIGLTGRIPRQIPEPRPRTTHGPAKVIAMCNQKGGVGKTTSTINLGASLAEYGRRVLLVDLDPQGALSAGLGVPHYELDNTVHNLLVEPRVSIDDVLLTTAMGQCIRFSVDDVRVFAGRQAVTWGVNYFWPVLDLFAPFAPERIDRDYKPGDIAETEVTAPIDLTVPDPVSTGRRLTDAAQSGLDV